MRHALLILASVLAIGCLNPRDALADGNVCNHSNREIWATFGEAFSYTATDQGYKKDWIAGWYHLTPGQCAKAVVGDVCFWWANVWHNCSDGIFYFADDANGNWWGGGGEYPPVICTTNSAFSEMPQFRWLNPNCGGGRAWRTWAIFNYNHTSTVTINFGN
jgi:hypothetical protein